MLAFRHFSVIKFELNRFEVGYATKRVFRTLLLAIHSRERVCLSRPSEAVVAWREFVPIYTENKLSVWGRLSSREWCMLSTIITSVSVNGSG